MNEAGTIVAYILAALKAAGWGADGWRIQRAYPPDLFDFIVIEECHRGGANDGDLGEHRPHAKPFAFCLLPSAFCIPET